MIRRALIRSVRWYQKAREGRPSPCRFTPSCSTYALEALETHGAMRGSVLTLRRLGRCRPFGPSGYDPVPEAHARHTHETHPPAEPAPAACAPTTTVPEKR